MVSARWFNEWAQFSNFNDINDMFQISDSNQKVNIKYIDNWDLIWSGYKLRDNLQEGVDYYLLNQISWNTLVSYYSGGPEICLFICQEAFESYNMLQLQLSTGSGTDFGYIGGFPDLNPIYINIEYNNDTKSFKFCLPVSKHVPVSIFKPWLLSKLSFISGREQYNLSYQGQRIMPQMNLKNIGLKDNATIQIVKADETQNQTRSVQIVENDQGKVFQLDLDLREDIKERRNRQMHLNQTIPRNIDIDPIYQDDPELYQAMLLSMNAPKITVEDFDKKNPSKPQIPFKTKQEVYAEIRERKLEQFALARARAAECLNDRKIIFNKFLSFEEIGRNVVQLSKNRVLNPQQMMKKQVSQCSDCE
ncbi:ubiquitin carboxyl-terminal hydrolase 5-like [Stylonychia lemnae]|uniref:Ubiquitin carboxyl-terminal hydrolase 5-like n=1 Tax=Stylonychia lemnae TaxID=5949 RepID=A0A078A2H3_STYLE|nr:ubiquitin carboxyl-terminal hydrolase 5-like [Stylonychia lemnae]|eukprot:CDW76401.1 ubiquitin carboxyl-terminal hydrolase 5-like [Stylonychia lemnae]